MPLITTLPSTNLPGTIANTAPTKILTVRYATNLVAQVYTLDLNPIAATIVAYSQYSFLVRGAQSTMIYQPGSGTAILDLTSQLVQHINRLGYFWASITGAGTLRLTSREPGINNNLLLQTGLFGATQVQLIAPSSPLPVLAGSALFWDTTYNISDPWASRLVTTLDVASVRSGFNLARDFAGVSLRDQSNYGTNNQIGREFEIMRQGDIWVTNYGSVVLNRSSVVVVNNLVGTNIVPSGSFTNTGTSLVTLPIQYQTIANPNTNAIVSLNLV